LPLKYFCLIFPLKEEKGLVNSVWDFSGITLISAVSLTPRKLFQHVIDTAKIWNTKFWSWCPFEIFHFPITVISEVSMTPLKSFQQCHWHSWNCFSGVNDTAEIVSVVSMTRRKYNIINFLYQIQSHMQNVLRPWIRAIGGLFDEKNRSH
jgi:hypothetical protein